MRRTISLGLVSLSLVVLAGCGGGGGTTLNALNGSYNGVYRLVETSGNRNEWSANMNFTINNAGLVAGTMERNISGFETSPMDGTVQSDGRMEFAFRFPGMSNDRSAIGRVFLEGTRLRVNETDGRIPFTASGGVTGYIELSDIRKI